MDRGSRPRAKSLTLFLLPRARHWLALSFVGLALAACAVLAIAWHAGGSHTYSVAEIRRDLLSSPGQWLNQTVSVDGVLHGCDGVSIATLANCSPTTWQPTLADATSPSSPDSLLVTFGKSDSIRTFLLSLPLLNRLAPAQQSLTWGSEATYHVRLKTAPADTPCGDSVCYVAELVNVF